MSGEQTELGAYILALCTSQNLSLRAASLRAGLEAGTISKILQRDGQSTPLPETLGKIAAGLGGDFLYMMRLAGHLPPSGDNEDPLSGELHAKIQRYVELLHQIAEADPERAKELLDMLTIPVQVMRAMLGITTGEELEETEELVVNGGAA